MATRSPTGDDYKVSGEPTDTIERLRRYRGRHSGGRTEMLTRSELDALQAFSGGRPQASARFPARPRFVAIGAAIVPLLAVLSIFGREWLGTAAVVAPARVRDAGLPDTALVHRGAVVQAARSVGDTAEAGTPADSIPSTARVAIAQLAPTGGGAAFFLAGDAFPGEASGAAAREAGGD